jgi:hypothetical protein
MATASDTHTSLDALNVRLHYIANRLRHRNRFFRIIFSTHVRDLQVIAILSALLITCIIYLWGRVLFSSVHTDELDKVLDKFYTNMVCLELHSDTMGTGLVDLQKAQGDLANARGKIQDVNSYLWAHISIPSHLLKTAISDLDSAVATLAANAPPPTGKNSTLAHQPCSQWPKTLSESQATDIKAQLPIVTSFAKHLTSTLAYSGSTLSVWAVAGVFGTVFLTFGGWLYRTGDARMTIIDVIASEIFSLCRAMTNNRSVRNIEALYESKAPPYTLAYLEIHEEYNDFMHTVGQNLGFLDQSSIARVTGFYTSLKILRDRMRMLKNWAIDATSEKPSLASHNERFVDETLKQTMYDLFLCLENARIALHLLLEGDDLHDDSIFVCMMSEIRAFVFLAGMKDNVTYIRDRLDARLQRPVFRTHEELESYLHPAYIVAVRKMCEKYKEFYNEDLDKVIVEKLCSATEKPVQGATTTTGTSSSEKTCRSSPAFEETRAAPSPAPSSPA